MMSIWYAIMIWKMIHYIRSNGIKEDASFIDSKFDFKEYPITNTLLEFCSKSSLPKENPAMKLFQLAGINVEVIFFFQEM